MKTDGRKQRFVVGVDLGGTKVEACLLDTDRRVLARHRFPAEPSEGLDHVLANIENAIGQAAGGRTFEAVGIGTPGTYEPQADRLYGSPHTPVYETPGFLGRLGRRLRAPLLVENDANCLALAEYFASCAGRYRYVMAVILGTGMGFGLILDGKLYRGARGGAGEIGHTSVDIDGRPCQCGRLGCAEAYLSGPSLSRRFQEMTGEKLEVQDIYRLYEKNHPQAVQLFDDSCHVMAEVFADVINSLDLEAIILGGGVSNLPVWYEKVPSLVAASLFGIPRPSIPLIKARLGDSAGVVGAAYLALRHLGVMTF